MPYYYAKEDTSQGESRRLSNTPNDNTPPVSTTSPTPKPNGEFGYYLDDGDLMLLSENISDLHRQDVLNSVLFAQLASDYKYDRRVESKQWSSYYEVVLGEIGWVLEKSVFHNIEKSDVFVLSDVTINQFANNFSGLEKYVEKSLQRLLGYFNVSTPNDKTIVSRFYDITSHKDNINFGVTVCVEGVDNSVQMFTLRVSFKVCQASKSYLFHRYSSKCVGGKYHVELSQYLLNEPVFNQVLDTIKEKLGPRVNIYVFQLKVD